jgi:hypothetical protein
VMARIFVSCSWCHESNQLKAGQKVYCWSCGHRGDVPRVECDCRTCRRIQVPQETRKGAAA